MSHPSYRDGNTRRAPSAEVAEHEKHYEALFQPFIDIKTSTLDELECAQLKLSDLEIRQMKEMLSGSCLCGDITYTFTGDVLTKALCHCLTCRKLSAGGYTTCFLIPDPDSSPEAASNFKLQSRTNTPMRESSTIHENGVKIKIFGCAKCPSMIYKTAPEGFPGVNIMFAGCLDGGEGDLRAKGGAESLGSPQSELWVKYRLPWLKEVDGAKQCRQFDE